jgi:hypothetical protein
MYSSHGKYAGHSFQYGTMNKPAFTSMFHGIANTNLPSEEPHIVMLVIDIDVQCSPELALFEYVKTHSCAKF